MVGLFTSLLLMANHKEGFTKDGTKLFPGQFMTSQLKLSKEFKTSRTTLRRKLEKLENAHQIEQRTNRQNTIITITNWHKYQVDEQQSGQRSVNERSTNGQRVDTNKNVNNNNNEKNDNNLLSLGIESTLFDAVIQSWNETCGSEGKFKVIRGLKPDTKDNFFKLLKNNKEFRKIETWRECFEVVKFSPILSGQKQGSNFVATLVWLIDSFKIVDVLNGQYGANKSDDSFEDFEKYMIERGNIPCQA